MSIQNLFQANQYDLFTGTVTAEVIAAETITTETITAETITAETLDCTNFSTSVVECSRVEGDEADFDTVLSLPGATPFVITDSLVQSTTNLNATGAYTLAFWGVIKYFKLNNIVFLQIAQTAASPNVTNAAAPIEFPTLLPSSLRPLSTSVMSVVIINNGALANGVLSIFTNGTIQIYPVSGNFTAAQPAGLLDNTCVFYSTA